MIVVFGNLFNLISVAYYILFVYIWLFLYKYAFKKSRYGKISAYVNKFENGFNNKKKLC